MARKSVIVQVKDRSVTAPDVQQFAGATIGQHGRDTILLFESEGATSAAKREAERIEAATGLMIRFEKFFGGW